MRTYKAGKGDVALSFDDYHPENLRIDEILHKQGIEATFYIETQQKAALEQIKLLFERGHEIGCHTIHHPGDLKLLPHIEVMSEVEGAKKMIETITNRPCESFCYPRGRFNDSVVDIVRRAGFKEARTTHVLKTRSEDPYRTPTTIHMHPSRKEYLGRPLTTLIDFYLEDVYKNGGTFHLWGHAFEFIHFEMWEALEETVLKLGKYIEV